MSGILPKPKDMSKEEFGIIKNAFFRK